MEMISEEMEERLGTAYSSQNAEALEGFVNWANAYFPISLSMDTLNKKDPAMSLEYIIEQIKNAYQERESYEDGEALKALERYIVIRAVDRRWQDHLTEMEEAQAQRQLAWVRAKRSAQRI